MPNETIGEYEIDYAGVHLPDSDHWAAMLTIYGPSPNPMHRNCIFPEERVSIGTVFTSAEQAEAEAHKVAIQMIEQRTHPGSAE